MRADMFPLPILLQHGERVWVSGRPKWRSKRLPLAPTLSPLVLGPIVERASQCRARGQAGRGRTSC